MILKWKVQLKSVVLTVLTVLVVLVVLVVVAVVVMIHGLKEAAGQLDKIVRPVRLLRLEVVASGRHV